MSSENIPPAPPIEGQADLAAYASIYGPEEAFQKLREKIRSEARYDIRRELEKAQEERARRFWLNLSWWGLALYAGVVTFVSIFAVFDARDLRIEVRRVRQTIREQVKAQVDGERAETDRLRALLVRHKIDPDPKWREKETE